MASYLADAAPVQGGEGLTLASYFEAFSPAPEWDRLPQWPPDIFALTNLVLDHTETYRFAVAPPAGVRWPPSSDWNVQVREQALRWRANVGDGLEGLVPLVRRHWDVIATYRDTPLAECRNGHPWELCEALLTLHALSDEACAGLGAPSTPPAGSFEARAWALLERRGSLSSISPARVRIVPKTHFAARGMTIRSLSRYLALCYESVDVSWRRVIPAGRSAEETQRAYNAVIVPWPFRVQARDFRPVEGPLENMDREIYGFFEFAPPPSLDMERVGSLLREASRKAGTVDALLLPEAAIDRSELEALEEVAGAYGCAFLITGIRERSGRGFGRNYVYFGVLTDHGWERCEQDKHHRWCLDGRQIRQYHLGRALDGRKLWWEAIDLPPRALQIVDVGGGVTTAPLVCEDLARMDEAADLLRRIGPTIVVAILLDGPQLATRWPNRYAGVLSDEPGSAVLTLTSLGMAARSVPPGAHRSRVIALWNDSTHGAREIELGRGAGGVLLKISLSGKTVWTADGRNHGHTPDLVLSEVHQLHPGSSLPARGGPVREKALVGGGDRVELPE